MAQQHYQVTSSAVEDIGGRLQKVRDRMASAAVRARRSPNDVTLIAITKTHPAETVLQASQLGVHDFGENRLQEAEPKILGVGRTSARWHLVGHLQSNKARKAVQVFDVIHTVDSADLAVRLDRLCEEERRNEFSVLIQVDLGGEESKSGIAESGVEDLAVAINNCANLKLKGLMTLPPYFEIAESVRPYFIQLRELRDRINNKGYFGQSLGELSMGMSHDFEIAIEEGATMVRVGTAIFGERETQVR